MDELRTEEHKRDGNGNVIMTTTATELGKSWIKRNLIAAITGAFMFVFAVTTIMMGVIFSRSATLNTTIENTETIKQQQHIETVNHETNESECADCADTDVCWVSFN